MHALYEGGNASQRQYTRVILVGNLQIRTRCRVGLHAAHTKIKVGLHRDSLRAIEAGDTVLLGRVDRTPPAVTLRQTRGAASGDWTDVPACSVPTRVPCRRHGCLRALEYDEAQEIASSGAKVLMPHPTVSIETSCEPF